MCIGLQRALHHHDRKKTIHYVIECMGYLLLHVDPNYVNRFLIVAAKTSEFWSGRDSGTSVERCTQLCIPRALRL